jgi:hypothetical protein
VTASAPPFELLGVLVAKALSSEVAIGLDFNPPFFDLASGRPIALAKSLDCDEGLLGLDFTYPGTPDVELMPGGADVTVTNANVRR